MVPLSYLKNNNNNLNNTSLCLYTCSKRSEETLTKLREVNNSEVDLKKMREFHGAG